MPSLVAVIDWQNVCLNLNEGDYIQDAINRTAEIVAAAKSRGDYISWVAYAPNLEAAMGDKIAGFAEPLKGMIDSEHDYVFIKQTKSVMGHADFKAVACDDAFDEIIFTGYSVTDCVQETIEDCIEQGLGQKITLIRDACGPAPSSEFGQTHELEAFVRKHGGRVLSTRDYLGIDADLLAHHAL